MDFPMKNGGSFHSFLHVYQRVIGRSKLPMAPRNSRKGSKFDRLPNYGDLAMKKMVIFQRYLKNY